MSSQHAGVVTSTVEPQGARRVSQRQRPTSPAAGPLEHLIHRGKRVR